MREISADTFGHATDWPKAEMASSVTTLQPCEKGSAIVASTVSAMPAASTRASPKRSDNRPVSKIWQIAATTPTTAKARPTSRGPQLKRAALHNPNTYSMPMKAQPARNVTSISRAMTGWVSARPITAQRLGPSSNS